MKWIDKCPNLQLEAAWILSLGMTSNSPWHPQMHKYCMQQLPKTAEETPSNSFQRSLSNATNNIIQPPVQSHRTRQESKLTSSTLSVSFVPTVPCQPACAQTHGGSEPELLLQSTRLDSAHVSRNANCSLIKSCRHCSTCRVYPVSTV